jgi:hypothetical protein
VPDLSRFPRLAWRLGLLELRMYAALGRWVLRRKAVPTGAEPWGYARLVTPMLCLWVFGGVVETVAFHFIIPWPKVRLAVDVIDIWGVVWMLGLLASYQVRPHVVALDQLRVRNGVSHDIRVPLAAVSAVVLRERDLPSSVFALHVEETDEGRHVGLGVSGRTNITLRFAEPTLLDTAKGQVYADALSLWADDPRALADRIRPLAREAR